MSRLIARRVLAALMLLVGAAVAVPGVVVSALVGPDNTASLASYRLPGTTHAFRADLVATGEGHGLPGERTYGTYRLRLVTDATPGHIAVGPRDEAQAYLSSESVADAGTVIPFLSRLRVKHAEKQPTIVSTSGAPISGAWTTSSHTTSAVDSEVTLYWPVRRGIYTAVAESTDATSPLRGTVHVDVQVTLSFLAGTGAAMGGFLLIGLAIAMLVRGGRVAADDAS